MSDKTVLFKVGLDLQHFNKDMDSIRSTVGKLDLDKGVRNGINGLFLDLKNELDKFSNYADKEQIDIVDAKAVAKNLHQIENYYLSLMKKLEAPDIQNALLIEDKKALNALNKFTKTYKSKIEEIKKEKEDLQDAVQLSASKKESRDSAVQRIETEIKQLTKEKKGLEKLKETLSKDKKYLNKDGSLDQRSKEVKKLEKIAILEEQIAEKRKNLTSAKRSASTASSHHEDAVLKVENFDELAKKEQVFSELKRGLNDLSIAWKDLGIDLDNIKSFDQLEEKIKSFSDTAGSRARKSIDSLADNIKGLSFSFGNIKMQVGDATKILNDFAETEKKIDGFYKKLLSFFSVTSAFQLFQRTVRDAINTVKELDATMTEAAVVTDFSVGDMWDKLPQYSKEASKLGVSINDLYGATTLYYQQGLKTEAAMSVGIETMKMARIANMDAEEATKAMTAALRGFNMEVNEMNATRVNDVYSELAAITAADTSQIATAMSKTASIANAANMEFETTAALLAQIIETTQEAPETAGTAMKTIIARFTEVKKLADQGMTSGKDGEGEDIQINKIDEALQRVGISLSDFLKGTKGIDDIFLELASKWDSLDLATQRYIATQAAGSRQQSRFLAMMGDYGHTMELVDAANNSAGASQDQFGKTTESLESKVNKLKNAWDTFTMSVLNNNMLKAIVDLGTKSLNFFNDIFDKLSFGSETLKTFLTIATTGLGILGGKLVVKKLGGTFAKIKELLIGGIGEGLQDAIGQGIEFTTDIKKDSKNLGENIGDSIKNGLKDSLNDNPSVENIVRQNLDIDTPKRKLILKKDFSSQKFKVKKDGSSDNKQSLLLPHNSELKNPSGYLPPLKSSNTFSFLPSGPDLKSLKPSKLPLPASLPEDIGKQIKTAEVVEDQLEEVVQKFASKGDILQELGEQLAKSGNGKVGGILSKIGDGFNLLDSAKAKGGMKAASILEKFPKANAFIKPITEQIGKVFSAVSKHAGGLLTKHIGGLATKLGGLITKIGPKLAGPVGIIVGIIIDGLVAGIKGVWQDSIFGQLAEAKEEAKAAQQMVEAARGNLDKLTEQENKYSEIENHLNSFTKGTAQWNKELVKANAEVLKLVSENKNLEKYLYKDTVTGQYTISEAGFKAEQERQEKNLSLALGTQFISNSRQTRLQSDVDTATLKGLDLSNGTEGINSSELERRAAALRNEAIADSELNQGISHIVESIDIAKDRQAMIASGIANTFSAQELDDLAEAKYGNLALQGRITTSQGQNRFLQDLNNNTGSNIQSSFLESGFIKNVISATGLGDIADLKMGQIDNRDNGFGRQMDALGTSVFVQTLAKEISDIADKDKSGELAKILEGKGNESNLTAENFNELFKGASAEAKQAAIESVRQDASNRYATDKDLYDRIYGENLASTEKILKENEKYLNEKTDLEATVKRKSTDLGSVASDFATGMLKTLHLDVFDLDSKQKQHYREKGLRGFDSESTDLVKAVFDYKKAVDESKEVTAIEKLFGGQETASRFGNMLNQIGSESIQNVLTNAIREQGNADFSKELTGLLGDTQVNSVIELQDRLLELKETGSDAIKKLATEALEVDKAFFSTTSQANELFSSISPDSLKELGQDGKITATEILELGKSNKKVSKVLENTGVSAGTLGTYYQMLNDNVLSTSDSFGDFVKVLDKARAAQNTIEDSFGFIDTFKASRSETDIGAWWESSQEKIIDLIDKGAYSSSELQDYVKAFYGEENWGNLVDTNGMKEALQIAKEQIGSYGSNMYSLWTQFANSGNAGGMASIGENGQIDFNMQAIGSVENLKKQLQEATPFSDEVIDAMIADAQTFSEDFKTELNKLSLEDSLTEWLSSALTIDDTAVVTQGQARAMAQSLGVELTSLLSQLEEQGVTVVDSFVSDGTLSEAIKDKVLGSLSADMGGEGLDLIGTYNMLVNLGMDDTEAQKAIEELTTEAGKDFNKAFVLEDGVLKAVETNTEGSFKNIAEFWQDEETRAFINGIGDEAVAAEQEAVALYQGKTIFDAVYNAIISAYNSTNFLFKVDDETQTKDLKNGHKYFDDRIRDARDRANGAILGDKKGNNKKAKEQGARIAANLSPNQKSTVNAYDIRDAQTKGKDKKGKEEKKEYWDNPFDEFFNLTEKINEEMRTRERLEREYNRILEDETKTYKDLIDSQVKRTASLNRESDYQQSLAEGKLSQIQKAGKRSFADSEGNEKTFADWGVTNLARYDANEGRVIIDWQGLEALTRSTKDADKGKAAEEYIKLIQGFSDELEEAQDKRDEIRDELEKIRKENIQKYLDFENRVLEAVKQDAQNRIDNYKDLSDSLSKSTTNVLDSLQESIDLERQIRNNTEKEEDIASKERRLAYLRMDTSGASDLEILQLEEELERDREAYSDELVDQHLQDLSDENQKAAEQRQLQIDTMQAQLDYAVKSGQLWEKVHGLIDKAINGDGSLNNNSPLVELLKSTEGYAALSAFGKDDWGDNLAKTFAASMSGYAQKIVDDAADRGSPISLTNGGQATYNKSKGRWEGSGGYYSGGVTYDVNSGSFTGHGWTSNQSPTSSTTPSGSRPNPNGGSGGSSGGHSSGGGVTEATPYKDKLLKWANSISYGTLYHFRAEQPTRTKNGEPYTIKSGEYFKLKGKDHLYYWSEKDKQMYPINSDISESRAESLVNYHKTAIYASGTRYNGNGTYGATKLYPVIRDGMARAAWHVGGKDDFKYMKRPDMFKTGGLADYTGPAWLDGTKSHPELVLNAQDTENFIKLKDILGSIMSNSQPSGQSTGDNYYDIHINVDEIANDYDVDQMMNRLEKRIHDEATYRNVNAINFLR